MHRGPGPSVKDSAALERRSETAPAHPDGAAARGWNDATSNCRSNGRLAEHGDRAHMAYDRGGLKALESKPSGGRKRENMSVAEERALLARFARAAGAGEMLNIHDSKAAYEKAIGHETSNSTVYNLLARHV